MKRCFGCIRLKESSPHCEHCGFDERNENSTHQLPLGTVVGDQFVLGRVLGQGGFGITYLAWDQVTEQTVAVKEYFPSGYAGRNTNTLSITSYDGQDKKTFESNKKRFLREAEALGKLWNIPQIVKVLRCFEENGTVYIAMEYVEGMDLRKYIKRKGSPMTIAETLAILGPIIEALSHVHQAGLVHRDISPDNIMVLPDGSAKLLDFGAARYVQNADAEKERATSTQAILKHGFAPPEQYQSHGALGPWTDVYAICATMYYCLTGKVPPEAMSRVIENKAVHWDQVPGLTARQRSALEKGMALTPKDRFSSARELWEKLGEKKKQPAPKKESPKEAKPQKERTAKSGNTTDLILLVCAAALVILIGIGFFSMKKPSAEDHFDQGNHQENAVETAAIPTKPPLEIASLLEFENAQLGETGTVAVLSEHEAGSLQWSSDDPEVATVSWDGTVTAVGYGMAVITAEYEGQAAVCTVYVDRTPNIVCTYEENETGLTITGYEGTPPREMILPRKIDGKSVVRIGNEAFSRCDYLSTLIIPEGITEIGKQAFYYCSSLKQVTIPKSVTSIEDSAFNFNLLLTQVFIPDTVTFVGSYAFGNTAWLSNQTDPFVICGDGILIKYTGNDTHVEIPSTVKQISNAFVGNSHIRSVNIPDSVTTIGSMAFTSCKNLISVSIPESVTSIANHVFSGCLSLSDIHIPENVISLGNGVFYNCTSLSSITIPQGIPAIGAETFRGCDSLTSINIPERVTSIGNYAFLGCDNLSDVIIPDSVTSIGYQAFEATPWLSAQTDRFVIVGDGVLVKYNHTVGKNVVVFSIPDSVKSISNAFENCESIKMVTIPDYVTYIGDSAFSGCKNLTNITLPKKATYLGSSAFENCTSLSSIFIPEDIETIESSTFSGCTALRTVTIPDSVKTIGYRAFHNCYGIKEITIPKSVTTIERQAFFGAYDLKNVTISKDCTTGERAFAHDCVIAYY